MNIDLRDSRHRLLMKIKELKSAGQSQGSS